MATIRKREFLHSFLYEVQIRRSGTPQLTISFHTLKEANEWVLENEFEYLRNPHKFRDQIEMIRLSMKWYREVARKEQNYNKAYT